MMPNGVDIEETKKDKNHAVCFGPADLPVFHLKKGLHVSYHTSKATSAIPCV